MWFGKVRLGSVWFGKVWFGEVRFNRRQYLFTVDLLGIRIMATEEEIKIKNYINKTWPEFKTKVGVGLYKLFPEPENTGLKHIWKYGHADISVLRNDRLVCLIEPGGGQHFEERQSLNDRRKWKLAEINRVKCLKMTNGLMEQLSKKHFRKLIRGVIYGKG